MEHLDGYGMMMVLEMLNLIWVLLFCLNQVIALLQVLIVSVFPPGGHTNE